MKLIKNTEEAIMGKLINDVEFRFKTINSMTVKNRIEVSSAIERYQSLLKERLLISGKLYGSTKYQEIDKKLHTSMSSLRQKVETIINLY